MRLSYRNLALFAACCALLLAHAPRQAAPLETRQASAATVALGVVLLGLAAVYETLRHHARRERLWRRTAEGEPGDDGATPEPTRPARILLMRHADKTGDRDDIHLSDDGRARAEKLVTYIPQTFGKPDALFAAAQSKRSNRSIETLEPLAKSLGLEVQDHFEDDDVKALAAQLFEDPSLAGKTIVICWHHSKLPKLARMLGAPDSIEEAEDWPDDVYNVILDFRYGAEADPVVTRVVEPF